MADDVMTYPQKITFGEMRASGVRDVLVYFRDHHIAISAEWLARSRQAIGAAPSSGLTLFQGVADGLIDPLLDFWWFVPDHVVQALLRGVAISEQHPTRGIVLGSL